ncbi:MAG: NADH-quinone oxidoreductase subunit L [Fidelibacterota bacterium]|nr:MAG: NADH-quinone oxidoreductase subunit L [Candidatus Neomarinimicrobiota bacterium]
MADTLYLITLFPLLGFLINGLLGRWLSEKQSGLVASGAILGSFLVSAQLLLALIALPEGERLFTQNLFAWIPVGELSIPIGYRFDPLSAVMTLVVSGVGLLIHIYSIGYMHADPGIRRYFAFLNLFTFMMLSLVLADNLVLMFLGWEGVGLCSYLLIGFWFEDEAKARAGMKAFIVNRIGDAGFIIAMILLYDQFGTLSISKIAAAAPGAQLAQGFFTAVTLLMFLGATGKSAQIPLYVWLPDAMAGPTPVSALIHAATMVTAGVYLIARNSVLFSLAPATMSIVAFIGILTALYAATIAITQNDIKKVLAYSTISQLGYMFTAVGVGAFSAGIFHLMTHAFFKGLLFLGAGSVIHSMNGEQDMGRMGGLKNHMPTTHWTMLIGVLAIAGIPGLSGFFSKDEILWGAFSQHEGFSWIWLLGVVTAGLTAFYMFRLFFRTFYGDPVWEGTQKPHESPSVMTLPLVLLAFLSIFGGYVGIPAALGGSNPFHHFLEPVLASYPVHSTAAPHTTYRLELLLMLVSTLVVAGGIYYAYRVYIQQPSLAEDLAKRLGLLYRLSFNKYFVDEIYDRLIIKPFRMLATVTWEWFDVQIVDGAVNGSGHAVARMSGIVRKIQNGLIQHYASIILLGVIFILIYIYFD